MILDDLFNFKKKQREVLEKSEILLLLYREYGI